MPFDPSKKYEVRGSKDPARYIGTLSSHNGEKTLWGVKSGNQEHEILYTRYADGSHGSSAHDIVPVVERTSVWRNVYNVGGNLGAPKTSREAADRAAVGDRGARVGVIEFKYEDGEYVDTEFHKIVESGS